MSVEVHDYDLVAAFAMETKSHNLATLSYRMKSLLAHACCSLYSCLLASELRVSDVGNQTIFKIFPS